MSAASPYRLSAVVQLDPEPTRPTGCPCGCSLETRQAYAAVGGWWHTPECDTWRAWYERRTGRKIKSYRLI